MQSIGNCGFDLFTTRTNPHPHNSRILRKKVTQNAYFAERKLMSATLAMLGNFSINSSSFVRVLIITCYVITVSRRAIRRTFLAVCYVRLYRSCALTSKGERNAVICWCSWQQKILINLSYAMNSQLKSKSERFFFFFPMYRVLERILFVLRNANGNKKKFTSALHPYAQLIIFGSFFFHLSRTFSNICLLLL